MPLRDTEIREIAAAVAEEVKPAHARRWLRELQAEILRRPNHPLAQLAIDIENFASRENPHTPQGVQRIRRRVEKFLIEILNLANAKTQADDEQAGIVQHWVLRHDIVPSQLVSSYVNRAGATAVQRELRHEVEGGGPVSVEVADTQLNDPFRVCFFDEDEQVVRLKKGSLALAQKLSDAAIRQHIGAYQETGVVTVPLLAAVQSHVDLLDRCRSTQTACRLKYRQAMALLQSLQQLEAVQRGIAGELAVAPLIEEIQQLLGRG